MVTIHNLGGVTGVQHSPRMVLTYYCWHGHKLLSMISVAWWKVACYRQRCTSCKNYQKLFSREVVVYFFEVDKASVDILCMPRKLPKLFG